MERRCRQKNPGCVANLNCFLTVSPVNDCGDENVFMSNIRMSIVSDTIAKPDCFHIGIFPANLTTRRHNRADPSPRGWLSSPYRGTRIHPIAVEDSDDPRGDSRVPKPERRGEPPQPSRKRILVSAQPRLSREPCPHGAKYRSACRVCSACPHGRQRCRCKDCGGASICSHGRKRTTCRECGGGGLCGAHARQRSLCKECGGGSICAHGRRRVICKDCGGAGLCPHGRQHHVCKPCGGASICAHGRRRDRCKPCVAKKFIAATSKS